jgi:hypothetical protein
LSDIEIDMYGRPIIDQISPPSSPDLHALDGYVYNLWLHSLPTWNMRFVGMSSAAVVLCDSSPRAKWRHELCDFVTSL